MRRTIVFWNLGRLFGSSGSPIEFALTADSEHADATAEEVQLKLDVIAAVIDGIAVTHGGAPLAVAFAEIENAELAEALASRITAANLKCVDHLAEDETGFAFDGLDITALIDESVTEVVRMRGHIIDRTFDTRDILEIDLETLGQPWSLLVNHWPSRLSGEGRSKRISAAHYLAHIVRQKVRFGLSELWDAERATMDIPPNEELITRSRRPVAVMGDFNDEIFNELIELLNSTPEADQVVNDLNVKGRSKRERFRSYRSSRFRLLNPFWAFAGRHGSYYRSPRWRTYDQILLSRGFCEEFEGQPLHYVEGSGAIHAELDVVLAGNRSWRVVNNNDKPIAFDPERGRGCSDHFPVVVAIDLPD